MKNQHKATGLIQVERSVKKSLRNRKPVVALETTVITHGLPFPTNVRLADELVETIRRNGAAPALIGFLDGRAIVGMSKDELARLLGSTNILKVSAKDIGICCAGKLSGGSTVSATMEIAYQSGIRVFATGGIGGVHRGSAFDISNDLHVLSKTPMIVVCAGPKAILDIPATKEYLETVGVPVIGFKTDEVPAFYTPSSGVRTDANCGSVEEIAAIAKHHWTKKDSSAILVVVPPPSCMSLSRNEIEALITRSIGEAKKRSITGAKLTPFLLGEINNATHGESTRINLELLLENARVASLIASSLANSSSWLRS